MTNTFELINDDCLVAMKKMADNSFDSIVTDPPYELGFMGKSWDASGVAYNVEVWAEALRILKPGGHLLAFGGSRTYHRVAVAIEDAGFQIRDSIAWIYGSGFPKSMNVSKAIDKQYCVERTEVISTRTRNVKPFDNQNGWNENNTTGNYDHKAPVTDEAKQWDGWGTALKPAIEPIVVARKPLIGTVAENVLTWGVGGLNIDGSRIGTERRVNQPGGIPNGANHFVNSSKELDRGGAAKNVAGRWPANIILDEVTAALVDEQTGVSFSPKTYTRKADGFGQTNYNIGQESGTESENFGDSGGASRFFYVAKASKRDRNEGLDDLEAVRHADRIKDDGAGGENPRNRTNQTRQNFHPTVKPTQLMRYLVRLVTPPDGTVLDPFMGSGSTGKACMLESFNFVGIEQSKEYINICEIRIKTAQQEKELEPEQLELYE